MADAEIQPFLFKFNYYKLIRADPPKESAIRHPQIRHRLSPFANS